jgi:oxalate decarboxylase
MVRDAENPDLLRAPATDHGTVPNLRFSFSDAHNRLEDGGWAREVTVRELPAASACVAAVLCTTTACSTSRNASSARRWTR